MSQDSNHSDQPSIPIENLAARMLDAELTEAESTELMSRLRDNPAELDRYVDQIVLHALLRKEIGAGCSPTFAETLHSHSPICPPLDPPTPSFPPEVRGWSGNTWQSILFFALGLFVAISGMSLWFPRQKMPSGPPLASSSSLQISPVAYLTSANGCAWGGDSVKTWTVGHSVESGSEIALHEGIAEFRLANGVSFGMEGPASLLLVSPSKLMLQYGKLTAHVPWGSGDFKVVSAGCRIVARDAEFGLSLTGNKFDIHVFSGEVTAASSIASAEYDEEEFVVDNSYFTDAVITAGRALHLMAQGETLHVVGWDKAAPSQFVAKLSMSGTLTVTREYIEQIKSARPISYWRFEEIVDSKIANEVNPDLPLIAGDRAELVGEKGNLSAEFRWNDDWHLRTSKRLPLAGESYSIEAWVKPSHLHQGSIVYLDSRGDVGASARLELQGGVGEHFGKKPGVLRYSHRSHKGKSAWGTSCYSSSCYAVRRWQHVVAVKTPSQMKLYLDGKLIASVDESGAMGEDPFVTVGLFNRGRNSRKFIGQIDELAIYDRVLTEEEISKHYKTLRLATKAAKPESPPKRPSEPKEA